jgi:filamentous hemagglutinin
VALLANQDLTIQNAATNHNSVNDSYCKNSGMLSGVTTTTANSSRATLAEGSIVSGNSVYLQAGQDLRVQGSAVAGDSDVKLTAGNDVTLAAATATRTEKHHSSIEETGFLSGGGFGITYGQRTTTTDQDQDGTTQSGQSRSMVGSNNGNLGISAGNAIKVNGSDLAAAQDVTLAGKSVTIDPGQDDSHGKFSTKMTQDGLTLAVGGTVVNAIQTVQTMSDAAAQSKNTRVKALAAATAAMAVSNAAKDVAANGVSVNISLTVGHSETEQTQTTANLDHSGSTISAGNNLAISATGGGKDSNISVIGSDLTAKNNVQLSADNQINLLAAQDTESQHSQSSSMSASAGIAASVSTKGGMAFGVTGSLAIGRGNEDGEGTTQRNSHVTAGQQVSVASGGDTTVKGAVVAGKQVTADIGGSLNLASLQDTAKFDSKNQSASISATVGYGANVSGSINQSKIKSDYASVQEQSGIQAGDDGFQIKVAGNTDLKGAVIASTQAAIDRNKNSLVTATLTQSDISNHSEAEAESIGLSGSASFAGEDGKDSKNNGQSKEPATGQGKGPGGSDL